MPAHFFKLLRSHGTPAHYEVKYQRNDRENQQQVDQAASDMRYGEAANPGDQQNNKQDCPDTHFHLLPLQRSARHQAGMFFTGEQSSN
jgi:hypothetical protein